MNTRLPQICFSTWLTFTFLLCNTTIWLYAGNSQFFDKVPYTIMGVLLGLGVTGGFALYILCRLLFPVPNIKTVLNKRVKPIKASLISISIIWSIIPVSLCIISSHNQLSKLNNPPKLIVIGLDAATWDLLNPWMEEGKFPHLKSIKDNGVSSTLISMDPMRSPSLWTTICTGVPPEDHGIRGFFSTRSDLKTARVWDVMAENGISVGLFNWLLNNPPEQKFAFCIPAWLARTAETHPLSYHFLQEMNLDQSLGGGNLDVTKALTNAAMNGVRVGSLENMIHFYWQDRFGLDDESRLAKKMPAETAMQTDVFLQLLQEYEPQVATITFYGSDKLAHRFWHFMEPDAFEGHGFHFKPEFADTIENYYIIADQAIGRILNAINEDTTVMVLSDHGMKADPAFPRQFFLDTAALLKQLKISELFRHQTIMRQTFLEPVFDDALLMQETKSALQSFGFTNRDSVFRVIIENGKLVLRANFSLTWNEESPLLTEEHIQYAEQTIQVEELFFLRIFSGTHDLNGILMMQGPNIKQGESIANTNLVDIAPTLLLLMNQPISKELNGSIIKEAFNPGWFEKQTVKYVDSYEAIPIEINTPQYDEALLERLRSMGYVE